MGPIVLLALSWTLMCLVAGCTEGNASSAPSDPAATNTAASGGSDGLDQAVAAIGGTSITRQQLIDRLLANYGAQTLRTLMLRIAVEQEAADQGIEVTEDDIAAELRRMSQGYDSEDQFYDSMREQLGMSPEEVRGDVVYRLKLEQLAILPVKVSDEEISRYIEEHEEEFGPRTELRISHIAVPNSELAKRILGKLEAGEEFKSLAMEYSTDEFTSDAGGDLGWVQTNDPFVAPEVIQTAENLEIGQSAGPIETENGIELIQLTGKNVVQAMDSEEARKQAHRELALGNSISLSDLENQLLAKYGAQILDSSLKS
ncbi:peptidylprolyl isomerase [Cohnella sp. AR92]|uniref:peptidylprolyl isomerase n=1 Tax=Cohnella sp. AR92 TaxID=648716 RepID=UPI00131517B2|nr:peptidylprolyl isomerase [Cohnella sp. AR92]